MSGANKIVLSILLVVLSSKFVFGFEMHCVSSLLEIGQESGYG